MDIRVPIITLFLVGGLCQAKGQQVISGLDKIGGSSYFHADEKPSANMLGKAYKKPKRDDIKGIKKAAYQDYEQKNYIEAEANFREYLRLKRDLIDDPEALLKYAQVLSALGRHEEAAEAWSTYNELNRRAGSPNGNALSTILVDDFNMSTDPSKFLAKPKIKASTMTRIKDRSSVSLYSGTLYGVRGEPIYNARVRFINKCQDTSVEKFTDKRGHYSFFRNADCDYEFVAVKPGYASTYEYVSRKIADALDVKPTVTVISKFFEVKEIFEPLLEEPVKMDNFYHEINGAALNEEIKKYLSKLIPILEKYQGTILEIVAHTDSRGSAAENLRTSQRRADEMKAYLISRNIPELRIKALGMGETALVNDCKDGIQCTEAEHRRNRRTEFKLSPYEPR